MLAGALAACGSETTAPTAASTSATAGQATLATALALLGILDVLDVRTGWVADSGANFEHGNGGAGRFLAEDPCVRRGRGSAADDGDIDAGGVPVWAHRATSSWIHSTDLAESMVG